MLREDELKLLKAVNRLQATLEVMVDPMGQLKLPPTCNQPTPQQIPQQIPPPKLIRKLLLRCSLCPGDILMLTAAVRELHKAHPTMFITDVDTTCSALWENNPNITKLKWHKEKDKIVCDEGLEIVDCHYNGNYPGSINNSDAAPYHFIHGYAGFLSKHLSVPIPITEFKGAIYLSKDEKGWISQVEEKGYKGNFWIIVAGGKSDYTAKMWDHERYQKVVDHFKDKITFCQVGEKDHLHKPLQGVVDLIGQTNLRQFIRLMYHADGVLCPVTFAMHLAAAVETKPGKPKHRPCVVVAGGREPPQWESYAFHRYLDSMGSLPCCMNGGCWKSRVVKLNDNDEKDKSLCSSPVKTNNGFIPKCLDLISVEDVIKAIESYQIKP